MTIRSDVTAKSDWIVREYQDGKSIPKMEKELNCSQTAIETILRKNNVEPRERTFYKKYSVNTHFFDQIDTEEKAYWLGFITADGNVWDNNLQIGLGRKDRGHLEKFLKSIGSNIPIVDISHITKGKENPASFIRLSCKPMCESLKRLGVTERKSLTIKPCDSVPENLIRHYLRGMVDGDGHIAAGRGKNGKMNYRLSLCGTIDIVVFFRDFAYGLMDFKPDARKRNKIYEVTYCSTKAAIIASELYKNSSIWLDRKREIADRLISAKFSNARLQWN